MWFSKPSFVTICPRINLFCVSIVKVGRKKCKENRRRRSLVLNTYVMNVSLNVGVRGNTKIHLYVYAVVYCFSFVHSWTVCTADESWSKGTSLIKCEKDVLWRQADRKNKHSCFPLDSGWGNRYRRASLFCLLRDWSTSWLWISGTRQTVRNSSLLVWWHGGLYFYIFSISEMVVISPGSQLDNIV